METGVKATGQGFFFSPGHRNALVTVVGFLLELASKWDDQPLKSFPSSLRWEHSSPNSTHPAFFRAVDPTLGLAPARPVLRQ